MGINAPFKFQGTNYSLLMFYTGADHRGSHDQIGVAFANAANATPWVRYTDAGGRPKPLIRDQNPTTCQDKYFGVGQPSATLVSGGRVLLFYTEGVCDPNKLGLCNSDCTNDACVKSCVTRGRRAYIDMSNMDSGPVIMSDYVLTNSGLTDLNGKPDILNSFSVVYNGNRDDFFIVRQSRPEPTDCCPTYLSTSVQVAAISASSVWNGQQLGAWQVLGTIGPANGAGYNGIAGGYSRIDNPGLLRTPFGTTYADNILSVFFTGSLLESQVRGGTCVCAFPTPLNLWTYGINDLEMNIW